MFTDYNANKIKLTIEKTFLMAMRKAPAGLLVLEERHVNVHHVSKPLKSHESLAFRRTKPHLDEIASIKVKSLRLA